MSRYRVEIDPLDALLFGDDRSARPGLDHARGDRDPLPTTLHGAVGGFLWRRAGAWPGELLGPRVPDPLTTAEEIATVAGFAPRDEEGALRFPKPLHLQVTESPTGTARPRLRPRRLMAPRVLSGEATSGPWERVVTAPFERREHTGRLLVGERLLADCLAGSLSAHGAAPGEIRRPGELARPDVRMGNALDAERGVAGEGLLFARPYRRFRPAPRPGAPGAGFTLWLDTLESDAGLAGVEGDGFLGGDRGRARLRFAACEGERLGALRQRVEEAVDEADGFLLYLLTPLIVDAALADGWTLGRFGRPVAAVTGRAERSSGWDAASNAPRPLRTFLPAGTVFFFDWPDGRDRREVVREGWLAALGGTGGAVGWGRALAGVWRSA